MADYIIRQRVQTVEALYQFDADGYRYAPEVSTKQNLFDAQQPTPTKMETKTDLLVLAAGMGSRYGGLKQMDPMGPRGETVLDYSIYDAIRAGFERVVFIIRRDF